MRVAVVGGGIVGLTTALQLQREFRTAEISVFASSFDETTSHMAAGIFRVGTAFSGPTEEITRDWIRDSYQYYDDIRRSPESASAGVAEISGYIFSNRSPNSVKNRWMEGLVPVYRPAKTSEFQLVGGDWKYGSFFTTILTEGSLYLPWARQKLREEGALLVTRKIESLNELDKDADLIINCSGLGARELSNDNRLVPIRGHVTKVKAPWIKTCFYGDLDTYIIPGFGGVCTLGGSRGFESEMEEICPYETKAIRERCEKLIPSLSKAETLRHVVGFRPHRENAVRVEAGALGGRIKVVHNYGHGGYGVCTAPGTAKYAVHWAKEIHRGAAKL